MESIRADLFEQLRNTYTEFIYEGFAYALIDNKLHIKFDFNIGDKYFFQPQHIIPLPSSFSEKSLENSLFRNIIFNLGMAEAISYWKSACPPRFIIRAGFLPSGQLDFWKKLYHFGLGEFFHVNGIQVEEALVDFICESNERYHESAMGKVNHKSVLVPLGGGKDSVVTLEVLKMQRNCVPFIMNPREASIKTAIGAGFSSGEMVLSSRSIDPALLQMNDEGFLNGHTPFSALLAFTTVLVAYLYGINEIALSNESSANEPSIPGTKINHQYSKSFEFENDFRGYLASYISRDINYYSYLRPLNELQIAGLFSLFQNHADTFRSCNVGSKTNSWCTKCAKCLFTFIILSPFIGREKLVSVFGVDMLEDSELIPLLDQLSGMTEEKPFECVGTIGEVNLVLARMSDRYGKETEVPRLIEHYISGKPHNSQKMDDEMYDALATFGAHNIPDQRDVTLLKNLLHDIKY